MYPLLLSLALLVFGTVLLVVGADWFLDGAGDLARDLGVSALVIGVLLAGLEPEEMLTAAIASARGAPTLAVGNVIGTNVTIVTLALGLSAVISPMIIGQAVRRQALIATLVSILPIVLLFLGAVTQLEGVLLLVVFVIYTIFLFRTDQQALSRIAESDIDDDNDDGQGSQARSHLHWRPMLLTLGGLAAMGVGGPAIVDGAIRLAQIVGLSQGAMGATIVSLGTGAEMIALGISAAHKKRTDILVGGILGSFAYNLLVTLGLAATIRSIPIDSRLTFIALPFMVVAHLVLLAFVWHGKISRIMGALLIGAYVAYLVAAVLA